MKTSECISCHKRYRKLANELCVSCYVILNKDYPKEFIDLQKRK